MLASGLPPDPQSRLATAIAMGRFEWRGRAVTIHEYKKWELQEGFMRWWSVAFPEIQDRTLTDTHLAEGLFWDSLLQGLRAGERSHLAMYASIKQAESKTTNGSLSDYFEEPDNVPNAWAQDDKGEEE